jgi:hypothetical protein
MIIYHCNCGKPARWARIWGCVEFLHVNEAYFCSAHPPPECEALQCAQCQRSFKATTWCSDIMTEVLPVTREHWVA